MRTIDEIIASTQKATEAALREAFDAGRAHAASDLKSKMTAFFDSLGHAAEPHDEPHPAQHEEPAPAHEQPHEEYHPAPSHEEHHSDQHYN